MECTSLEKVTIPYIGTTPSDTDTDLVNLLFGNMDGYFIYDSNTNEVIYSRENDEKYIACVNSMHYIPRSFTELVITNSESIHDGACEDATSLKSIILPENLKSIGKSAFAFCESLEEIEITDGNNVSDGVFSYFATVKKSYTAG